MTVKFAEGFPVQFKSHAAWRDMSRADEAPGTSLTCEFRTFNIGLGVPEDTPLYRTPEDLLRSLQPESIEQHRFQPADVDMMEAAFLESLELPMPAARLERLQQGWLDYRGSQTAVPAPAA